MVRDEICFYNDEYFEEGKMIKGMLQTTCQLITLVVGSLVLFLNVAQGQNLEWYFNNFPHKDSSLSLRNSSNNKVLIDQKNGYIQIKKSYDTETGANLMALFTYFVSDKGEKTFAYQEIYDPGGGDGCPESKTFFYSFEQNVWQNVFPLPLLSPDSFGVKHSQTLKLYENIWSLKPVDARIGNGLSIQYNLPRYGTTIIAKLYCLCEIDIPDSYLKLLNSARTKEIYLLWDKKNRRFRVG